MHGWRRLFLLTQNPFQMLLPLLSVPTQTFNQQHTARRGTGDTDHSVLMITCFLLGLGSSSLAEGLKDFPLERGKHIAEVKIHHLGTGEPHSGRGAPSSCQDHCAHLPPLPLQAAFKGPSAAAGSARCPRWSQDQRLRLQQAGRRSRWGLSWGGDTEPPHPDTPQPARSMGQDHVTSTQLPSTTACAPPPLSAWVSASGEPQILQNTGFMQKASPCLLVVPTSRTSMYQKPHPALPAALGGPC